MESVRAGDWADISSGEERVTFIEQHVGGGTATALGHKQPADVHGRGLAPPFSCAFALDMRVA